MTSPSSKENQFLIEQSETKITLKEIILQGIEIKKYLMSKFFLISIITLIGGVLGYLYASSAKRIYTATTSFVLEEGDNSGGFSQISGLAALAGLDVGSSGSLFQGDNLLELYKSRRMIQAALLSVADTSQDRKKLLIDLYIDFNELKKGWAKKGLLAKLNFQAQSNRPLTRLQDSVMDGIVKTIRNSYLTVEKVDKKLSIVNVVVSSNNEKFSKIFNEKIVQNVNDFYVETKTKKSLENLSILQHQTDSVKSVLTGAVYRTVSVNDATPNLNPTRQILRIAGQKSQLNADANKAILTQLVQNLEVAKISLRKDKPLIQVIDAPTYPLSMTKKSRLKAIAYGAILALILTSFSLLMVRYIKLVMR